MLIDFKAQSGDDAGEGKYGPTQFFADKIDSAGAAMQQPGPAEDASGADADAAAGEEPDKNKVKVWDQDSAVLDAQLKATNSCGVIQQSVATTSNDARQADAECEEQVEAAPSVFGPRSATIKTRLECLLHIAAAPN